MIHVNVRRKPQDLAGGRKRTTGHPSDCVVEVSTDGGPWKILYQFDLTVGDDPAYPRRRAEDCARILCEAWRYAGVEYRATSFGYGL
jgi:hypothetical protein